MHDHIDVSIKQNVSLDCKDFGNPKLNGVFISPINPSFWFDTCKLVREWSIVHFEDSHIISMK